MKSLLRALGFLSIVPLGAGDRAGEEDMARSARAFPLAGLLQGLVLVAADVLFGMVFNPNLVIALVLLVLVLTNGGFHLDGLADTFDALAARGGREGKLRAMRDGSAGPAGVTAIVFSLGIKYLALKSVSSLTAAAYYSSLLFMPMLSRWVMVTGMFHGRPARQDGLGKIFMDGAGRLEFALGTATVIAAMTLPVVLLPSYFPSQRHVFNAAALVALYSGGRMLFWFFGRTFGGLTGDVLGAGGEISENVFLLMVLLWSQIYSL